jgi:RHS repeat-associated protein
MNQTLTRRALATALAALQILPASLLPQLAQAQQTKATKLEYDAQGNLTKVTDPNGKATLQSPDSLDRVQSQTLPAPSAAASSPVISYTYDGLNRLSLVKDGRGVSTSFIRVRLDDVMQVSPDSGSLRSYFDEAGNLSTRTNQRKQYLKVPSFDALNRPLSVMYSNGAGATPVDTGAALLSYDEYSTTAGAQNYGRGHLTNVTQYAASGAVLDSVSLRYDQLGRLTRRCQFWAGVSAGSESACTDADALRYTWGAAGSADAGRLLTLTYPSGRAVNLQYDSLGRISAITTAASSASGAALQTVVSSVGYKPLGVSPEEHIAKSWTFGAAGSTPAQTHALTLGASGWPTSFTIGAGAIGLSGLQPLYKVFNDDAGRIKSIVNYSSGTSTITNSYVYDDLNRLTQASLPGGVIYSYDYDLNGNRTLKTSASVQTLYTYSSISNKLSSQQVGSGAAQSLTSDATGNITKDPAAPVGAVTYVYDDRTNIPYGRLIRSQGPGAQWDYAHNYFGQRIRKSGTSYTPPGGSALAPAPYIGSADTLFYYDEGGHLLAEHDAATKAVKREYIWLGDTVVGVIAGSTPSALITPGTAGANPPALYYVHTDHLGTPRLVTDTAGNRRWSWDLMSAEPFGASAPNEAPAGQAPSQQFTLNLRFPGQYLDKETGSFYNYFRTYNPSTGRYLQSDPIGLAGGLNTYAYVGGNPVTYTDPLGLAPYSGQTPPSNIPGGPWTPAGSGQQPGTFFGPQQPGGKDMCRYVPDGQNGGPAGAKESYWKTKTPNSPWQRYDTNGNPITPEEAHPGNNGPKIPRIPFMPFILCPLCTLPGAIPGGGLGGGNMS